MNILPRHYIFGIIMFTFMIVGGMSILSELRADNENFGDDETLTSFNDTFNTLDDVTTQVGELAEKINTTEADAGVFGVLDHLINRGWNAIKLLFSSFSFMNSVFNGLNEHFGVPQWISTLIATLITVLISFAIYTAIFQREI